MIFWHLSQYNSIMMADSALPKISLETRAKLDSYGFSANHLYDSTILPSYFIPRTKEFNTFTYAVMALSALGGLVAKRYGVSVSPFAFSFVAAPFFAFLQKKQSDFNHFSSFSKRDPKHLLQHFPLMNECFKIVDKEIDEEITKTKERIALLTEKSQTE